MSNLGRNDPCHCGSGKKYKKCHLEADQRSRAALKPSPPEPEPDWEWEPPAADLKIENLPNLLRQLSREGPAGEREEFARLLSMTEPMLECMRREEEIDAATDQLESHRPEFEKLMADQERYLALAEKVFAEECFVPLRFTASDVKAAFEHVGYLAGMASGERSVEVMRAAILHIADEERRGWLATNLLPRVADFVTAGRHLDAWLVRFAAYQTTEERGESNMFLFQMFSYGYDAWRDEGRARDESLLGKLGLSPEKIRGMSLAEIDAWLESQQSGDAYSGLVDDFFRENPDLRAESIANLEAMERNSARLLERPDSHSLLLSPEEIQPWQALLEERASQPEFALKVPDGVTPEEHAHKLFDGCVAPLMREMADSVFTPGRIAKLVADLKKYRDERFKAGDKAVVGQAVGAINYLEREDSPGQNVFLIILCWRSLDPVVNAVADEPSHGAD